MHGPHGRGARPPGAAAVTAEMRTPRDNAIDALDGAVLACTPSPSAGTGSTAGDTPLAPPEAPPVASPLAFAPPS